MKQIPQIYFDYLRQFIAIESISTDKSYLGQIEAAVIWLDSLLQDKGLTTEIFRTSKANPVILAYYIKNPNLETILIYGHYDVQPAPLEQGWTVNPFELTIQNDKILGRGAVDNKGQFLIHLVTIFELIQQKKLNYNIKILLEGNEESGNDELAGILADNKSKFQANHVLISDGEILGGHPLIDVSLRGGMNAKLNLATAKHDVHSGIFGGAIPNAAAVAANIVANLYTADNEIAYPEFYKNVDPISAEQIALTESNAQHSGKLLQNIAVKSLRTEPDHNFFSQTGLRPTIQITGLKTGYTGTGYANIVPAQAEIRFNFRIVASQDINQVKQDFADYLKTQIPDFVDYRLEFSGLHSPIKINLDSPIHQKAIDKIKQAYDEEPRFMYVGGAIPFVADIKSIFGIDALLVPLANDDCNMHGPDENFSLDLIAKGFEFSYLMLTKP